jgi:hypothetical protein
MPPHNSLIARYFGFAGPPYSRLPHFEPVASTLRDHSSIHSYGVKRKKELLPDYQTVILANPTNP